MKMLRVLTAVLIAAGFIGTAGAATTDWSVLFKGTQHDAVFDVQFDGAAGIAVGVAGTVLESDDGGQTWTRRDERLTTLALLGVALDGDVALAVSQMGALFRRDGETWSEVDSGTEERLLSVALQGNRAVAVGGFGAILVSEDRGLTWSPATVEWTSVLEDSLFTPHVYDVDIAADGTITVGGEFAVVLQSSDGGKTWAKRYSADESLFKLSIDDNGTGLGVGQNGLVIRTTDGGASWTRVDIGSTANLLGVSIKGSDAAIVGIRAAFRSTDGGASWEALEGGDIAESWYQAVAYPEEGGGGFPVAVGHSGRIVAIN